MASLESLLKDLFNRTQQGGKANLSHMLTLSAIFDHPHKQFRSIHVAGTNGKGSVAGKIAKGLQLGGSKTGLFTSPHLAAFNERIQIDGNFISDDDLHRLLLQLFAVIDAHEIPATFFEISTMLALLYFREQAIDCAVIEAGIGGRLDATNIILPDVAVITSISLDHCHILGDTHELIAREKGGIIKENVPIVIGPAVPRHVILDISAQMKAPCVEISCSFAMYDDENNAVASKVLELMHVEQSVIAKALVYRPPCRMEIYTDKGPPALILDVAHNPDGLYRLCTAVSSLYPNKDIRVLLAMSYDKDIPASLSILSQYASHFHFTTAHTLRSCPPEVLHQSLLNSGMHPKSSSFSSDIAIALKDAIAQATAHDQVLVACGTFFIMSTLKNLITQIASPAGF
jgi:dihydrofolate synthase/folylpolyglutamate synthase